MATDRSKDRELLLIDGSVELRRRIAELEAVDTKRKRAEEALKEYSERLEEMIAVDFLSKPVTAEGLLNAVRYSSTFADSKTLSGTGFA